MGGYALNPFARIHQRLVEENRRFVVGITGGYCAGKSRLAQWIVQEGARTQGTRGSSQAESSGQGGVSEEPILHIEVDHLGHQALEQQASRVEAALRGYLDPNNQGQLLDPRGGINRRALGGLVFSNPQALATLESITHPAMVELARKQISDYPGGLVLLNAAILFKMNLESLCDTVVWVDAPLLVRFFRALERDNLGIRQTWQRFMTQGRMKSQLPREQADIICVSNWGGTGGLRRAGRTLAKTLWNRIEA